jgi:excisionase family DNA binding protein
VGNFLLSTKEAGEKLGLSKEHVRRLLGQGKMKGKKVGRDWIVFNLEYKRKRKPKHSRKTGVDQNDT